MADPQNVGCPIGGMRYDAIQWNPPGASEWIGMMRPNMSQQNAKICQVSREVFTSWHFIHLYPVVSEYVPYHLKLIIRTFLDLRRWYQISGAAPNIKNLWCLTKLTLFGENWGFTFKIVPV